MKINFKCKCGKSKQTVVIRGEMILDKRAARFYELMRYAWESWRTEKYCRDQLAETVFDSSWTPSDFYWSAWVAYWLNETKKTSDKLLRLGY